MKKITTLILLCFSLAFINHKSYAQCVNLYLGAGNTLDYYDATFTPIVSNTVACNSGNIFMYPQQPGSGANLFNTPCMRFIVNPTNANSATRNSITLFEYPALNLVGCQGPLGTCANNIGPMPNNSNSTLFASYLDPTGSHTWSICNVASAVPNMNYSVSSCYNNVAITTGIWNAGFVGCNPPIVIPANTTIGTCTYNILPFVAGALTSYPWAEAQLVTSLLTPGTTYTITYTFNTGNGVCPIVTAARTIYVTNPYNASWTAIGPLCANGPCVNLPPQVTGTAGGTWVGTGVVTNSFCPSVGAGSYPVTYSVGISALCSASNAISVSVTPVPVANAGPSKSITCTNPSTVLVGSGGGSYSWTGAGITGGAATANPTVNLSGVFTLSVTVNGCTSPAATVAVNTNTTPPGVAPSSGSLNCLVVSTTAAATTGAAPVSYVWTGPGITGGAGTGTITLNLPGTYNYTVTNTSNGCKTTGNTVVLQNIVAPPVVASSGSLNCTVLSTTVASTTGAAPVSYNWTGPGVTGGALTGTATVNLPGTYNYTVTNTSNGCVTSGNVAVAQNITAPAVAASSGSLNCTVISTTVVSTTGAAPVSYNWTGPGITGGALTGTATVNLPGTYNYTVTNTSNGCVTSGNVSVVQNITAPAVAASSGSLNCTVISTTVVSTTGAAPVSYNWTGPGITGGALTGTATVNLPGTYNYTVTNTSNGCTTTGNVAVAQNITLPPVVATAGSLNCTVLTTTVGSTTGAAPVTYTWTGPSITAGANTGTATVNSPGTYNYTVTNTSNGCKTTGTIAVIQNTTAPAALATSAGTVTCVSPAMNLTVTPAGMSYTWSPPFGGLITSGVNSQFATGSGPGVYSVVVINPANGCTNSTTVLPTTNTVAPTPSISPTPSITCTNTLVTLSGAPAGGVLYSWTGPGVIGASNQMTVNVNQVGTYSLLVTSSVNGCTAIVNSAVGNFTIPPTANAGSSQTVTCLTPSVQIIGSANPSTCTVVWTGGVCAGPTSYTASACSAGIFTMTATNPANGCSASSTVQVFPNAGSPIATLANTGTLTCLVLTSQVTSTTAAAPVIYTWSGPGIIAGAGTQTITVNMGGVYTLTLTNTLNGCSSIITNSVTANNAPVTPTAVASNTLTCNTTTINLTAGAGAGSFTYNWSGAGIVGSNTLSTITSSVGGAYTATVTETTSGCTGTVSISAITNTSVPTSISVTPSSFTLSCATPTTQLVVTTTGGTTYTWTAPVSGSILSGVNSTSATISGPGTYSVVATGTNGCSAPAATAIIVANSNAPSVTLSTGATSITCLNTAPGVTITPTGTVTIATYSWSPTIGIATGANTTTPTFTAAGTYSCLITANNGCTSSTFVTVSNNSVIPTTAGIPVNNISCLNTSVIINPVYTPTTGLTYIWFGGGIVGATTNGSVTVNQSGTYSVNITDPSNGCSNTITVTVIGNTVAPTATVSSSTSTLGIGCAPGTGTAVLTANTSPTIGLTFSWSTGVITSTMSTSTPGNYSVVVTDPSNSCSVAVLYTVNNNTAIPNANAGTNGALPCGAGATSVLSGTSTTSGVTYTWLGNGIVSGSNTPTPIVNLAGIYTLTVSDPNTGCFSTSTVAIINTTVIAGFMADFTVGVAPLTVNFTNTSIGAVTYNWNFGNGATSTQTSTSNVYNGNGSFVVTLIATSGLCSDTAIMDILVNDGLSIEIPNVFTPNDDGINDVLTIKSTGVKELSLQIFNRWGQQMYEFTGTKAAWDGVNSNGNKAAAGTYFYFVKATGFDDKEITKNGPVSLFR